MYENGTGEPGLGCCRLTAPPAPWRLQTKGKAAIDVICNPLGKSGGALIQQFMIIGFGSLAASTPYLGLILLFIVAGWILAAKDLDWRFSELQADQLKEAQAAGAKISSTVDSEGGLDASSA